MLKRWCLAAFLLMLAGLLMKPAAVAAAVRPVFQAAERTIGLCPARLVFRRLLHRP